MDKDRRDYVLEIRNLMPTLRGIIKTYNSEQLLTPYRLGGWTVQQVIHHMADNDMNAYIRLKRALTEDEPMAASYREDLWAELNDYKVTPIEVSITLLEAIHNRLIHVINGLKPADFSRKFSTQVLGFISIDTAIQRFIWHNKHHIKQIQSLDSHDST